MVERGGDHFSLPEIHRVRATLLLAGSAENRQEAETAYRKAIELAQLQHAHVLELRAATGLARLLAENGGTEPGYEVLSRVYNGFSEAYETSDLRDAKEVLNALA